MNSYIKLIKFSQENNPELGTYIHICKVVKECNLKRKDLLNIFNKVMPKDEYDKSEKGDLIDYLVLISSKK